MDFNALHQQNQPLLLANVWDASSAQAAQQAGYQALGSSSAAIAAMLGYEDGEEMSFDELFYVVSRIKTVSELPLSVDLEAGYGATTSLIIDNIPVVLRKISISCATTPPATPSGGPIKAKVKTTTSRFRRKPGSI